MSLRATAKALPTALKISFSEAIAYRAEMLVWVLSTTMPFVQMALMTAVARGGPIGGYGQKEFVAYYLGTFVVRQLSGSWAAWQMNFEIRQGTLSMRLLRPFPPIVSWALEHLAAIPMRIVVVGPAVAVMFLTVGGAQLPDSVGMW
ncbi:MAG: ABC-2 family transporter protein, partial [Myxococcaceae bacterium]|nr:ABC-2 family transporter protein [Myxococcaceae bacterium]